MTNWPVRLPAVCMPGSQDDGKSAMPRPSAHHHPGALDGHGGAGRWMVKRVGQARGVHVMMKDGDFEGKCIFMSVQLAFFILYLNLGDKLDIVVKTR